MASSACDGRRGVAERCRSAIGAVLTAIGLGGCGGTSPAVTATALHDQLQRGERAVVLDARTAGEYRRGHVPGARHVGFVQAGRAAEALGIARDAPIVVYCEHGPRAALAAAALRAAGYRDVRLLGGHMAGWRAAGLPVER